MEIQIDRYTNQVVGLNGPTTAIYLEISIDDTFTLQKVINVQEGEKQKTNDQDQLLYFNSQGEEVTTQEIDGIQLQAIMVPNMVPKAVSLKDQPEAFTLKEVVAEKFCEILKASTCDHIIADCFIDEDVIDLTDPHHSANTGIGICEILPMGQVNTKTITLEVSTAIFNILELEADEGIEIYLNDYAFTEGQLQLPEPVTECTLKFKNTTDTPKSARAYAVGY